MTKFIFVTGGVVSGLGKGITAASLGRLLKARGLTVAAQKLDPYMNCDPGTMSPFQHGEVFVTDDGAETDLDLGHYERFIDEDLNKYSSLTSGKIYWSVLSKERNGEFLGETVQVIPHITNEIKKFIFANAKSTNADVLISEIGGTIGDIESQPFIESARQIVFEIGKNNCLFIHVTLVPFIPGSNEYKTKPTQHSVKQLQSMGINPDIIVTRTTGYGSEDFLEPSIKKKISSFCNVKPDCVIDNITLDCLYEAPLMLHKNGLDKVVCRELKIRSKQEPDLTSWEEMIQRIKDRDKNVKIALVGKYVQLHDAYLSVAESLQHAGYELGSTIEIEWIDSEKLTNNNVGKFLKGCSGVLVPGGFGNRGIDGKIVACKYAREQKIPYFGICLGMQVAVIEFARNICKLRDANSGEFSQKSKNLVIDLMPDQKNLPKGGTMRLGKYPCMIKENTLLSRAYGKNEISERHRHRYEFNNDYRELMEHKGLVVSGTSPDKFIVETIELPDHEFFVGVQFHPEFKSRPNRAHPLFYQFIKASLNYKNKL
ncbi:MAG: CTP synthase [Christensenellaceae bacterium]|jgi:CTP synthase|nr:CTP synthase [Christensenellaceae bacterium]